MDFSAELSRHTARVEAGIDRYLPPTTAVPAQLAAAMRYSMQAGGKRLRPVLVLAAAELFDPAGRLDPLPAAVAVECIHTYSLVHDDLPSMDDDDLRRGRPTLHKAYDEGTAVLAGDALLTLAFQLLGQHYGAHGPLAGELVRELGDAAGYAHLIGGQMLDLIYEHSPDVDAAILNAIHTGKTGGMIWASLVLGGRIGGAAEAEVETLRTAGRHLGLAFQIVDDILDVTADSATLGKTAGKDAKADKTTFVKIHGIEASRRFAQDHTAAALAALAALPGEKAFLTALAASLTQRIK
jgi:geranylgeranyl diphosphate synthase type II